MMMMMMITTMMIIISFAIVSCPRVSSSDWQDVQIPLLSNDGCLTCATRENTHTFIRTLKLRQYHFLRLRSPNSPRKEGRRETEGGGGVEGGEEVRQEGGGGMRRVSDKHKNVLHVLC